jgi:phosphatidylinositol alpha-1,6-mannosyltransferase
VPPGIVVVSEVFPPAIGGSGALLENIYRRVQDRPVRVIADPGPAGTPRYSGPLAVEYVSMKAPDWGVVRPASLGRHVRLARAIRTARASTGAEIHCARALPEGLSAAMALAGRGRYCCWLHGEELGFASTSRELTWLAQRIYRGASAIFANSQNSKTLLVNEWGVSPDKVSVVHPGVDVRRFRPDVDGGALRSRVAGPGDVVLLSVGRLQRRKGHDMMLRALAGLRQAAPAIKYVIVGDGPHRRQLEADVDALALRDVVHFAGEAREDELPGWYAAADVFALPNRQDGADFEGFGIVFLEAAAAGLPVVGGRSGGVPEAVDDGATGLLVDGADERELRAALERLVTSVDLRRALGMRGRQRATEAFSWDRVVERFNGLTRGVGQMATDG